MIAIKNNKPGTFFFLLAIIFAFFAAFVAITTVQSFNKQTTAFVPTKEIPPFTKITQDMVTKVSVPESSIIGNKVEKPEELVGRYSNTTIRPQAPITKEQLASAPGGELTAGLNTNRNLEVRGLPIPVTQITGFGGKLAAGDRIDFIGTLDVVTNQGNQLVTRMIAQNIPVISRIEDGGKLVGVVIQATAKEVQEISHYMESSRLKISVLPQPANSGVQLEPTVTTGFQTVNPIQQNGGKK